MAKFFTWIVRLVYFPIVFIFGHTKLQKAFDTGPKMSNPSTKISTSRLTEH